MEVFRNTLRDYNCVYLSVGVLQYVNMDVFMHHNILADEANEELLLLVNYMKMTKCLANGAERSILIIKFKEA